MTVQEGTSHVMAEEQPSSPAAKAHDILEAVIDVRIHLALVKKTLGPNPSSVGD